MIRRCKRCGKDDDGTLVEAVAGCGCVDLYCEPCRLTPLLPKHAPFRPLVHWLVGYGRLHKENGGRTIAGETIPCPSRWDDNRVQLSLRSLIAERRRG